MNRLGKNGKIELKQPNISLIMTSKLNSGGKVDNRLRKVDIHKEFLGVIILLPLFFHNLELILKVDIVDPG
jgi:hypothetical protein